MNIEALRKVVDEINIEIIALFSERLKVAREIAKVKKAEDLPVYDPDREKLQTEMLKEAAKNYGLSPAVIEEIFEIFVEYSRLDMKMEMAHD